MIEQTFAEDLFSRLPVGWYRILPDGRFLAANATLASLLHCPDLDSLLLLNVNDFYADPAARHQWMAEMERDGVVERFEVQLRSRTGQLVWLEDSARVVRDELGQVLYYEGILVDISEKRAVEQRLRKRDQAYEVVQRKLADQTALYNAASLISSNLDLDLVLTQIAREMTQAVSATSAYICSYNLETNASTVLAEYVSPEAALAERVSDLGASYVDNDSVFAESLLAGQSTVSHVDSDDIDDDEREHFVKYGAKSILYVPLLVFDELSGFAEIWESRNKRHFSQTEVAICQEIAQSAAIAIRNARHFADVQKQLELARILQQVGAMLTTRLDPEQVFESIFDLLGQAVEYDSASIQLMDEQGRLRLVAGNGFVDLDRLRQFVDALGDEALMAEVTVAQPLMVVADTSKSERWLVNPELPSIASWVGAALVVQERLIGILNVDSWTPNAFDQVVGEMVMAFANQAAVAIENARLYEAVQARASELAILNRVALEAAKTVDIAAFLDYTTKLLTATLYPDRFGFLLYDADNDLLKHHPSYHGLMPEGVAKTVPLEKSITGRVVRTGQPVLLQDTDLADDYHQASPATRSEVAVPLKVRGKVIGAINVESPRLAAFDNTDLSFLTTLAGQAAIAIERAELYQAQQKYMAHLAQEVNVRTAQFQAERDRIQAILDNAGEGIFFTDPSGTILYVNKAMTKVVGLPAADLLNRTPLVWQHKSEPSQPFQEMWTAIQAGKGWRGEMVGQSNDNDDLLDLFLTIAPIQTLRGHLAGFVGVLSDISRLKEVERLKTQFVSNISHELRTPLTNIETYVTLLTRGKTERRDHYLKVITDETRRLSQLINSILELSRLETEQAPLIVKPNDLNMVLDAVVKSFLSRFERRNVQLRSELPSRPLPVLADIHQLELAVTNLVSNALLYTNEGDEVVVSAGFGLPEEQQMVWLRVADNGPGIYPEDLPRLFDRFFRSRGALEHGVPGTGLGLAISKEIVQRLGGNITAESILGEGSTFTVQLPLAPQ